MPADGYNHISMRELVAETMNGQRGPHVWANALIIQEPDDSKGPDDILSAAKTNCVCVGLKAVAAYP